MLTTEVLTTLPQLQELVPEWDSLAAHDSRDGFCRTGAWVLNWLRYIKPDAKPQVIVVRENGRLIGIAPFCMVQHTQYLRALCFGGSQITCGDYLDIPCLPESRQRVLHTVFSVLDRLVPKCDLLMLADTKKDGDLLVQMQAWSAQRGFAARYQDRQICPYIDLPASFQDYLGRLSNSRNKELRRIRRQLFDDLKADMVTYSSGEEMQSAIDALIHLHVARWNEEGHSGSLARPGFSAFLKSLAQTGVGARSLRLYLLRHKGRAHAAMLNFHFGENALQFQSGWIPRSPLSQYSLGTLLIFHAIENAIQEGCKYYDFMRGHEDYKYRYTTCYRENATWLWGRSLAAKTYLSALNMKDLVKTSLGAFRKAAA